jgi:hypothetical protein
MAVVCLPRVLVLVMEALLQFTCREPK